MNIYHRVWECSELISCTLLSFKYVLRCLIFSYTCCIYIKNNLLQIIIKMQQDDSIFSILSFAPFSLDSKEIIQTNAVHQPKIKRRSIVHVPLKTATKKNGNMPKAIIGNFHKFMPKYKDSYTSLENYQNTRTKMHGWLKSRIDIGRKHLQMILGGESRENWQNCRVLREIISKQNLEIVGQNTKVENCISYLVCIEKYIFRLGNSKLVDRVQSR